MISNNILASSSGQVTSLKLRLEQVFPKFLVDSFFNQFQIVDEQLEERIESFISFIQDERIARYQIRILSDHCNLNTNEKHVEELENFVFNHDFMEPFKGKKKKQFENRYNEENPLPTSSEYFPLYLPKFNTFFKHKNENLHIEKDDEGFECFSSEDKELVMRVQGTEEVDQLKRERNIARSKAMISSFHLRIQEDVKPFVQSLLHGPLKPFLNSSSLSSSLKEATFGYIQTEEQANDFYRQLCGEDEEITLDYEMFLYEIRRLISIKQKKIKVNIEKILLFTQEFKETYLKYLRALDYEIVNSVQDPQESYTIDPTIISTRVRHTHYPKIVTNPPNLPLTLECIGHLSRYYFVPWMDYSTTTKYTPKIDHRNLIFPWLFFNSKLRDYSLNSLIPSTLLSSIKTSHENMYKSCGCDNNIINRIYGIITLNDSQSIDQIYSNFSSLLMKEYTEREIRFYEKEKRKLLPDQSDTDAQDLTDLLLSYRKKLENRARVSQFILKHQSNK